MANSGIPSNELNTRISIDDMGAVESLRGLKSQVGALMNSWKAQNAMLESAGEHLAAAKTRYEGLGDAIIKQNEVIEKLKSEQSELDTSTTHGAEVFAKLQKQVALAGKQLANMQAQQKRAGESMAYYQAGVDKANDALAHITNHSNAVVSRLEAQGNAFDAAKASVNRYEQQLSKLNDLYAARSKQAEAIAETEGKESKAYKDVTAQLDELSVKIAKTTRDYNSANDRAHAYSSGINDLKEHLNKLNDSGSNLVERLKAQGKNYQANAEQAKIYKSELADMVTLCAKQSDELSRLANDQGKDSDAYKKAASSLDELKTQIEKTKAAEKELDKSFSSTSIAKARDTFNKISESTHKIGDGIKSAAGKVAGAVATAGVAVAGASTGFVLMSKSASDLQATYKQTANLLETGGEKTADVTKKVADMQKQGREMSLKYGISQEKIADAYQDLVKRGDSSSQALGAMRSEIQASVASGDDLKNVTEVTSNAMESFGLKVDKAGKPLKSTAEMTKRTKQAVNDLAFAADKTSTSFSDIGVGMSYVGAVAHQAGFSLGETASAMGILSNNGLEADKAGTGLRKVISSLTSPSADAAKALKGIGLSAKDFVDQKGNMKSMSDIFGILEQHTDKMSKSQKAVLFHTLFGATGEQAGEILADNASRLKTLNNEVDKAAKHNYVGELAQKNMQTAQAAMNQFKMAGQDLGMTLAKAVLPTVSSLAEHMANVANSKGFQTMVQNIGHGLANVGNHLQHVFEYVDKHSKDVTSIGKSIASIIGELGSGVWSFFKTTIIDIGKAFGAFTGKKVNTSGIHSVAQALNAIAKNKGAVEAVGKAIAAYFVTKKLFSFANAIGKVGKGFVGLGKIVANTKPAKTLLEKLLGTGDKAKLTSEAANTVKGAVTEAGAKAAPEAATTGLSIGKGIAGKLGAGLGIAFNAGTAIHGLFEKGKKKYEDVGSGVAGTIGGAVGMAFGGPVGSMIGSTVGSVMGRVGGDIAHQAVAAWHKAGGWKGIQKDISNFCATMGKNIGHFASDIGKTWSNMGNTLNKITGGAWNNITSSFNKGKNDITHIFSDAQSILTSQAHGGANARINAANDEYHREVSISNQKMHDTIKNANSTCEQTIAAAERKRSQTIAKAQDEYENQHSISYSQYQNVVNNANQQCKESVDAARNQRNKTVEKAQDERDKVVHEAHEQRDKRIQAAKDESHNTNSAYEDMLQHMANIYNGIAKGLNNILDKIDGKKDTIPMWHPSHSYATGTSGAVNGGELALVGEEGFELAKTGNSIYPIGVDSPEIRWLPEGTQILPHDMSKAFSSLAAGLPHYKKGKDKDNFLSDAIKWTKGKIKDVADLVHKGADKVVKELFKTLGWDSYQKSLVAKVKNYTVEGAGKHIRDAAINKLKSLFSDWTSAHEGGAGGGVVAKNIGAHTGSWAGDIRKIADEMHVSVSDSDMQALLARIQKESGGDQSIKQQVWDVNMANGDPAQGLFQYIPPTFAYWSVPGHNNILSGDDQIRAVFNDSNWRSDIRMPGGWGPTGHRVFANGGIAIEPSIFGDAGAEMAIPLTTGKRSRAYELLGQLTTMFASEDGLHRSNTVVNNNNKIEKLLEQNNKLMNVLINIASGQLDQMKNNKMPNNTAVMKKAFYNAFGMDSKLNQFGSFN